MNDDFTRDELLDTLTLCSQLLPRYAAATHRHRLHAIRCLVEEHTAPTPPPAASAALALPEQGEDDEGGLALTVPA